MKEESLSQRHFVQTVKDTSRYIYSLSYRLTGSSHEASDLMQETYLKAFQKWKSVHNTDNPLPWLRKICVNIFIDGDRKSKAGWAIKETEFPSDSHDFVSTALSPEEELVYNEEIQAIKSQCYTILSSSLNMHQKISFVLIDLFQLDIGEVSRLIDKSRAATKSLLYRAREKMGRFLGPFCGLVSSENACRCKSWVDLSHDIQKRRDMLKSILKSRPGADAGKPEIRQKVHSLCKALPYLNYPPQSLEEIFFKTGK
jgi:RNA polymerase sigma factor (sigma-70 family)